MKDNGYPCTSGELWSRLLYRDLNFVYKQARENHPGVVDEQNPRFQQSLELGFQEALKVVPSIRTEIDARRCLMRYMARFADGHFTIWFNSGSVRPLWAGVWLSREKNTFVVSDRADSWPVPLPEIGDTLLICDDRPVETVINEDVLRMKFDDPSVSFAKSLFASSILIGNFSGVMNPYESCVFRSVHGGQRRYTLNWSAFEAKKHHPRIKMIDGITHYSIKRYETCYWVRLSNFQPNEAELKLYHRMLRELESIEGSVTVVFDVRGNNGGNSILGNEAIEALYGKKIFDFLINKGVCEQGSDEAFWRVSTDNLNYVEEEIVPYVVDQFGESSEYTLLYKTLATSMRDALDAGVSLVREGELESDEKYNDHTDESLDYLRLPRSIVITDECCGSACLDFVDVIRSLPGSSHLGKETAGDSVYMDVRTKELPSGIGSLVIPQKVYRNRARGNNESYKPEYEFCGNIYDDEAVKVWTFNKLENELKILPDANR